MQIFCQKKIVGKKPDKECDHCKKWVHPVCNNDFNAELHLFDEYYCQKCRDENPSLKCTYENMENDSFRDSLAKITPDRPELLPKHLQGDDFEVMQDENGHYLYDKG